MPETSREELAPAVLRQIERLGGVLGPSTANTLTNVRTVVGEYPLPEPIRQFIQDVTWPKGEEPRGQTYRSRRDTYPRGVCFGYTHIEEAYGCCGDHPYLEIADDATQFLYFVRLDCDDPSDPPVYRIDHEGQDHVGYIWSLSEFLASLKPEAPRARQGKAR